MSEPDNYYPLLEDINFNYKLQNHPEFYQYKSDSDNYILEAMKKKSLEKCNNTGGHIYKKIQMFVSSFLSLNTPYNGVLLYHGVGVGKTCASILISDNFKEYVKKHNKKIIILTKPTVKDGFRGEIFKISDNNIDKNQFTCTSGEYRNEYEEFIKNNKDIDDKKLNEFTSGIINDTYEIYGYTEFANKYENAIKTNKKYSKDKINSYFSNCVFIIDEIHNLREENEGESSDEESEEESDSKTKTKKKTKTKAKNENNKKSRDIIENIIRNLNDPIKLILLSATPMYDKYEEIDFIINLLLLNDKKPLLNRAFINDYVNNEDETAKTHIIEKTQGYISYIKGNDPHVFPLILYPDNNYKLSFNTQNDTINSDKINAVICYMDKEQKELYDNSKNITEKRKYSNVIFPNNNTFNTLFEKIEKTTKYMFKKSKEELCIQFLENISKYSTKINELITNLENSNGKTFIYSENKLGDYGGTFLLAIVLEHYGYFRKTIKKGKKNELIVNSILNNNKTPDKKKYFIMVDGQTLEDDFTFYKNTFNKDDNINGDVVKIIIGTTNMIEGVSLYNIRQIHVMQPWYNISRNDQIVGRGVRQCSHIKLPFNQRNITIFNYIAVSTELEEISTKNYLVPYSAILDKSQDIDLRKLYLATEKIKKITLLENLLKTNSIDCLLNQNINNIEIEKFDTLENDSVIEHIDSFGNKKFISYMLTDNIKCNNIEESPIESNEMYNYQLKTFMNKNLKKNTKYFIKKIFTKGILRKYDDKNKLITYQKDKIYFSYSELFNELKLYNSEIDEFLYKISLQDLILNKEIIYNKFNKPGYIILKGIYLIFKSSVFENIDLPFEFSSYPFNNKINTIDNYVYYSVTTNLTPKKSSKTTTTTKTSSTTTTTTTPTTTTDTTSSIKILSKNKQLINDLFNECKNNGLIESLKEKSIFDKYDSLWKNKLNPATAKKKFGLTVYKNLEIQKESELYNAISKILFNKIISPLNSQTENTLEIFYNNFYSIHFIFNYSIIIVTYLKCLFHRVNIQKQELNDKEQLIYNHYKYLIHSEDPLVFKFIDFHKTNLNIYDYSNIGIIYYEFDKTTDEWITHNISYKGITEKHTGINIDLQLYRVFPAFISKTNKTVSKFITNKQFIMEQLKIDEFDFNRIYNTFDLNNYYNHNNTYFKYSGNSGNPLDSKTYDSDKLSNIIGIIILNSSNSKLKLNDLSRNIFTLGTIFSLHKTNRNYYLKTAANTGYINISIPKTSSAAGLAKNKHVLYCILDQVEELNYKLLLEIILNSSDINDLWSNEEYKIKYFIKDLLLDINFTNPILTEEQYDNLNTYLIDIGMTDLDLLDLNEINKNLDQYKYKFYLNCDSIYNILSNKLDETTLISLMTYLLYDLDNYYKNDSYRSFYNKRWLLNLFESSLLNAKLLNIDLITVKSGINTTKNRIAESASFTSNTFILSKYWGDKDANKYNELDN